MKYKILLSISTLILLVVVYGSFAQSKEGTMSNKYVGLWVTEDNYIRHRLLPNNRYTEARGNNENAYQGKYKITGDHIDYWDDTGFTADGDFKDGILYHAGMVLYRKAE